MKMKVLKNLTMFVGFGIMFWLLIKGVFWFQNHQERKRTAAARTQAIAEVLERRQNEFSQEDADPFGNDDMAHILLIGIDKRIGQTEGHCDAIQLISIDRIQDTIAITAVPRGTYANLPPGTAATSTDYYVANSCALGGLDYGIEQTERILQQNADYVVVVGFSEALGIFRTLELPTTETLQWLRHRQGYQIGEPQRARNHSTFLKSMLLRFVPTEFSTTDNLLHQLVYKMIQTDLSFAQVKTILNELAAMDLENNPNNITLHMRPAYAVQDIPFDETQIQEHVESLLEPIKGWIPEQAYTGTQQHEVESLLVETIHTNQNDEDFISWAHTHNLWLQIENEQSREELHYLVLEKYVTILESATERESVVANYIAEKEHLDLPEWSEKGKALLVQLLNL